MMTEPGRKIRKPAAYAVHIEDLLRLKPSHLRAFTCVHLSAHISWLGGVSHSKEDLHSPVFMHQSITTY